MRFSLSLVCRRRTGCSVACGRRLNPRRCLGGCGRKVTAAGPGCGPIATATFRPVPDPASLPRVSKPDALLHCRGAPARESEGTGRRPHREYGRTPFHRRGRGRHDGEVEKIGGRDGAQVDGPDRGGSPKSGPPTSRAARRHRGGPARRRNDRWSLCRHTSLLALGDRRPRTSPGSQPRMALPLRPRIAVCVPLASCRKLSGFYAQVLGQIKTSQWFRSGRRGRREPEIGLGCGLWDDQRTGPEGGRPGRVRISVRYPVISANAPWRVRGRAGRGLARRPPGQARAAYPLTATRRASAAPR